MAGKWQADTSPSNTVPGDEQRSRAVPAGQPCRVEHRVGDETAVLARLVRCSHHFTEHDPYAAHLHLAGRTDGELVLVDEVTDAVVARRDLGRGIRRRHRPRPGEPPRGPGAGGRRRACATLASRQGWE